MYTRFVRVALVVVGISRVALAQPPADAQCKARRHALTLHAMAVTDLQERGRLLVAMPECRPDGSEVDHVAPPPQRVPLDPRITLGASIGVGTWLIAGPIGKPTRVAPVYDLSIGVRLRRSISIMAFFGGAGFPTEGLDERFTASAPVPYAFSTYAGREQLYDVGLRLEVELGSLVFGGGLGIETDHTTGSDALIGSIDVASVLALAELHCGYVVHVGIGALQVLAIATDASGWWFGAPAQTPTSGPESIASFQLAMRARL